MTLQQQIREDMKTAMRTHESGKVTTLRGLLSAFTNELVAQKRKPSEELIDKDVLSVIKRAAAQRKDSIKQFRMGEREDLAIKEEAELEILEKYLPEAITKEEIERVARIKIEDLNEDANQGQIIGAIMKEFDGSADGNDVKEVINKLLS